MTDKLRELAERLDILSNAAAARRWDEFSMRVPAEPSRDADLVMASAAVELRAYADILEFYEMFQEFQDELRAYADILDAEGDGGAVAWMRPSDEGYDSSFRDARTVMACPEGSWAKDGWIPLFTHPARSGAVSNKDVDEVMLAYNVDCHSRGDLSNARGTAMRAALESFARNRK